MQTRFLTLLAVLVFGGTISHAQNPTPVPPKNQQPIVVDSTSGIPIENAQIVYSSLAGKILYQTLSDKSGNFSAPPLRQNEVVLHIIMHGYRHLKSTPGKPVYKLQKAHVNLQGITVRGEKELAIIVGDTIMYSTSDFKTHENAELKNVLQQIPSLVVTATGEFIYKGVPVNELYIDGRPIGGDLTHGGELKTLAKTISAANIDSVQIFSKKDITGKEPSAVDKQMVMNVTTKKSARKGIKGNVYVGGATQQRYSIGANLQRFRDKGIAMFTVSQSNTMDGQQVNSLTEIPKQNTTPASNGLDRIASFSLNQNISEKFTLNTKASLADAERNFAVNSSRTTIQPSTNAIDYYSSSQNETLGKARTFSIDLRSKGKNQVGISQSISYNDDRNNNDGILKTTQGGNLINSGSTSLSTFKYATNYNPMVTFLHTNANGDKLSSNLMFTFINTQTNNYQRNFIVAQQVADTLLSRINKRNQNNLAYYNINLTKHIFSGSLFLAYKFRFGKQSDMQNIFGWENLLKGYKSIDSLSRKFTQKSMVQYGEASYDFHFLNIAFHTGLQLNVIKDQRKNVITADLYDRNFTHLAPTISLTYVLLKKHTLQFSYNKIPLMPTIEDISPIVDYSDPQMIRQGNPSLLNGSEQFFKLDYGYQGRKNLNVTLSNTYHPSTNSVSYSYLTDSLGRQYITPYTVPKVTEWKEKLVAGKRFKSGLTANFTQDFNVRVDYTKVNNAFNKTTSYQSFSTLSFLYHLSKFEMNLTGTLNYSGNKYFISPYTDFNEWRLFATLNYFMPFGFNIGLAENYIRNNQSATRAMVTNSWVAKTFRKKKDIQLKIYAFDLFNENKLSVTTLNGAELLTKNASGISRYFQLSGTFFLK